MNADHWGDLELLDHLLRGKTLSAAARAMRVNQTTVARRLDAFERRLGVRLFDRVGGRLEPSPELAGVTGRLRVVAEEAASALAILRRRSAELRGEVRLTSVGFVLSRILAPALGGFEAGNPGITLDLVAEDLSLSFARREADIALRLGRRAEDEARIKYIGAMTFGLYRPVDAPPAGRPVVRYGEAFDEVPEMRALAAGRPDSRVALRSSRVDVLIEAALALGAEIMLPDGIGGADPRFARVDGVAEGSRREIHLLLHPERARLPGVARAAAWAEETFRAWNVAAAAHGWRSR